MKTVTLIFIEPDGTERRVPAEIGRSVMQAAVGNNVVGVIAECGGNCACATCHCYIEGGSPAATTPIGELEADMLEFVSEPSSESRLTCQIIVSEEFEGTTIRVPKSQGAG